MISEMSQTLNKRTEGLYISEKSTTENREKKTTKAAIIVDQSNTVFLLKKKTKTGKPSTNPSNIYYQYKAVSLLNLKKPRKPYLLQKYYPLSGKYCSKNLVSISPDDRW